MLQWHFYNSTETADLEENIMQIYNQIIKIVNQNVNLVLNYLHSTVCLNLKISLVSMYLYKRFYHLVLLKSSTTSLICEDRIKKTAEIFTELTQLKTKMSGCIEIQS